MRSQLLIVAAIIILSQNSIGQESRPALPPEPPRPGMPAADDPDRDKPHLALNIPQVILPSDVERYSKMLGLSGEQQSAFERMYIAYREDCEKLNQEQMPAIARLSLTCSSVQGDQHDWEWFEDYEEFWKRQVAYMKEMCRREDALFEELVPVLTEEQIPKLPRVQMHRQRSRCIHFSMLPGALIDLTSLVEEARLPEEILDSVDPVLAEYESALTPTILRLQQVDNKNMVELVRCTVQFFFDVDGSKVDPRAPGRAERFQRILDQRADLMSASARAQERVAEVNRRFAPRVFELIPEPHRKPLNDEYLHLMHPFVYPDDCDPKYLFEEIVRSDGVDTQLREALQAMWDAYRQSYDSLTRQMIEACDKTDEQRVRTLAGAPESSRPEWELRTRRWDKSVEFIDSIFEQLPPELQTSWAARVEDYKLRTETFWAHAEHRPLNPKIYAPSKPASK